MAAVKGGMDVEMPFALHMRPKLLSRYMKKGLINEQQINESVIQNPPPKNAVQSSLGC